MTGNTVVDALRIAVDRARQARPPVPGLPAGLLDSKSRLVLITAHRRESFEAGFRSICEAIRHLADRFNRVAFVYPVHRNPNVLAPVHELLGNLPNVFLIAPLEYLAFVQLMDRATLILTNSGGIQEEAPSLEKPVLVMRDTTERTEAVEAGVAKLVGPNRDRIIEEVAFLLENRDRCLATVRVENPYGDGHVAERITKICREILAGRCPE